MMRTSNWDTCNSMIPVPLLNPKFAIVFAARCRRTSGFGALVNGTVPAPDRFRALIDGLRLLRIVSKLEGVLSTGCGGHAMIYAENSARLRRSGGRFGGCGNRRRRARVPASPIPRRKIIRPSRRFLMARLVEERAPAGATGFGCFIRANWARRKRPSSRPGSAPSISIAPTWHRSALIPAANVLSLPFLFRSFDHLHKVLDETSATSCWQFERHGFVGLTFYDFGARSIYNR